MLPDLTVCEAAQYLNLYLAPLNKLGEEIPRESSLTTENAPLELNISRVRKAGYQGVLAENLEILATKEERTLACHKMLNAFEEKIKNQIANIENEQDRTILRYFQCCSIFCAPSQKNKKHAPETSTEITIFNSLL